MTDTDPASEKKEWKATSADLATLIVNMSRLLFGLGGIGPFKSSGMGVAEWVGLSVIAENGSISPRQLARALGVSGQRTQQVAESLGKAGWTSMTKSENDKKNNEIKITEAGSTQISSINAQLDSLLAVALKDRERSLASTGRQLRLLMRIVSASNPERAEKRQKKTNRKAKASTMAPAEA